MTQKYKMKESLSKVGGDVYGPGDDYGPGRYVG